MVVRTEKKDSICYESYGTCVKYLFHIRIRTHCLERNFYDIAFFVSFTF